MDRVRKIAEKYFKDLGITKIPLDPETVINILRNRGWDVYLYSQAEDFLRELRLEKSRYTKDAFSIDSDDVRAVFYDDTLGVLQKVSALCHELGHDVIGHTGHGVVGKSKTPEDVIHEKEADAFALEFQAPAFKLYSENLDSVEKIVHAGILTKSDAELQYISYQNYIRDNGLIRPAKKTGFRTEAFRRKIISFLNSSKVKICCGALAGCLCGIGGCMIGIRYANKDILDSNIVFTSTPEAFNALNTSPADTEQPGLMPVTDMSAVPSEISNDNTNQQTPAESKTEKQTSQPKPATKTNTNIQSRASTPQPAQQQSVAAPQPGNTQPQAPIVQEQVTPVPATPNPTPVLQTPAPKTPAPVEKSSGNTVSVYGTSYSANMTVYKAKSSTSVFHLPGCSFIAGKNDLSTMSIKTALDVGMHGCTRCFK